MKILLITENYFPEANALANRSTSHAKFWSKKEKVFVITCFPNHPMGTKFKRYYEFFRLFIFWIFFFFFIFIYKM